MMKSAFNLFKGLLSSMLVSLLQACRCLLVGCTFLALICSLLFVSNASLAADPLNAPDSNMGGGEIQPPQDDISPATRQQINRDIDTTRTRLQALRILPQRNAAPLATNMVSGFAWPMRQAAGRTDNSYYGISNFVDQDSLHAVDQSHVKDYFCGTRSYDIASGYNHQGTDIFSWPFGWKKMDNNDVEIVAGAAGTIIGKSDGNFDRSCSLNNNQWNAVYVQHADGSVAWYGHMKNGSLTTKAVGTLVSAGEYLGVMGSSGSSTGPHLHLELYDASNKLVDPWIGACNTKSQKITWSNQLPYYDPTINAITVGTYSPIFPTCPTTEVSYETGSVKPGSVGYFTVYLRDQRSTDVVSARWYQPDGSLWQTATSGVPSSYYSAAYWYWYYTFPTSPTGIWRFEATVNGKTVSKNFPVGDSVTPCSYTLSASSAPSSSSLTYGNVSVASDSTCAWTATSSASWITITSGATGSGNGSVSYTVAANTSGSPRTGTLTIAGQTFTVTQAAAAPVCTLSANPATITVGSSSTLTAGCTPAATSYTWTGGTCVGTTVATCTATPTSTTTYSVTGTNAGGTGAAASATVTVNACTYALGSSSASVAAPANTGSVSVTSSCAWTAASNASWIAITSGSSGSGNGTVGYAVAVNTSGSSRTGTLTIAGQTFTVTQAAAAPVCTLSANPSSFTVGGSSALTASCVPTASSYTWIGDTCTGTTGATCTVTPTSTTTYSVTGTNAGGTGTAASATVTVSACTYGIGSNSTMVVAAGSSGTVSVTSSCTWTATSNAGWISIISGASGSGNGSVSYTVAANTSGSSRTGTMTITGQTFTVTQAAAVPVCTLNANPASITAGSSSTLTATCTPVATSYTWTGDTCVGSAGATCTVTPTSTSSYTVAGTNVGGTGTAVSATVTISSSSTLQPNADGTVFDPKTGLTWMRCSMGQTWTGSTCLGTAATYTFDQANALTGTTTFANQSDWRMPNIRELQTIVDRSVYSPAIDRVAFPNTPGSYFWSVSPDVDGPNGAWFVGFDDGYVGSNLRNGSFAVRLVRGGQPFGSLLHITRPTSDYVDHGNGTVTHTPTNLTWKRCPGLQAWTGSTCSGTATNFTFDQATALADTTTFAGQSDWRLPTEDELLSLVDYSVYAPAINTRIFPTTPNSYFWSGSSVANSSSHAWNVYFGYGYASYNDGLRSSSFAVRLVRGGQPLDSFVLAVSKSGTGGGTVIGVGINCGSVCSAAPGSGTNVTLTATPASGSTFTGWSGACTGTGTCTVSMTAAQNVTATFTNACTYTLNTNSATAATTASTGSISVTSSCAWTAASNASWITITSGSSGSGNGTVAYAVAANTGTTQRTGTITIAGQTFTVTQAAGSTVTAPICTLSANPPSITSGGSSTLTATCNPAATSYVWTGGTCAGATGPTCTVTPTVTATYSVQGSNAGGANQVVSATVTVTANTASYTVPGTLGNDVFVLTAGNSYYGGAGNDTFIISHNTLRGGVTAKVIDNEGDNLVQLVDGMTVTASSFYSDAAQLTLSSGAIVQILGASKFKFQVGANALAGDTAAVLTYSQFVSSLGASLTSGTLPASGTAGYVVPAGFTQAAAPVPSVAGSSYTVPGTLDDDVLVPSGGISYLGGGGNDVYIISPYTLSGAVTGKIIDNEGSNVIQLVGGLTIASSSFFSNAVQLTLSNGASVQILGASGFSYQLGANAPAGVTATSLSYAQFAAALGASVPAAGASAVSGSANFVVP
ncbi:MAG: DUF1566 domain-containing protein [Rhodoferax sp.]|nr:DUF1566 domain-containing protein [Rhodoferax sp.]